MRFRAFLLLIVLFAASAPLARSDEARKDAAADVRDDGELIDGLTAEQDALLRKHMNMLAQAAVSLGRVPASLDQMKPFFNQPGLWETVMRHPLTGESPAFEYLPPKDRFDHRIDKTPLLFELRGGKRWKNGAIAYGSGVVFTARDRAVKRAMQDLSLAMSAYITRHGKAPTTIDDLRPLVTDYDRTVRSLRGGKGNGYAIAEGAIVEHVDGNHYRDGFAAIEFGIVMRNADYERSRPPISPRISDGPFDPFRFNSLD